jgi:hypothetical protein
MATKKELIVKQARFWVVMAGGATLTAACEPSPPPSDTGRRQDRGKRFAGRRFSLC